MKNNLSESSNNIYQLWVKQIDQTQESLPEITKVAELWADKVVKQGGEVYVGGDMSFWREAVHRAGGISFARKLTPDAVLDKNDVVLIGFEYSNSTNRSEILTPILKSGATILLFAESDSDKEFNNFIKNKNQLILIPCDNNLDGLITLSSDSSKYISFTGMTNILHLWVITTEFISACTRLNQMPNIFVSITHPRGWSINGTYFYSRFYQEKGVEPVKEGVLGKGYLDKVRQINNKIYEEEGGKIAKISPLIVDTIKEHKHIREAVAGHWASYLPNNAYTPKFFSSKGKLSKDDLMISLNYNYYPKSEIEKLLDDQVNVIFMTTSDKDNDKFKGIPLTSNGQLLETWENLSKHENLTTINGHWPQYDSTLTLPDYPYPFIPSSWVSHGLVHWLITAETLENMNK